MSTAFSPFETGELSRSSIVVKLFAIPARCATACAFRLSGHLLEDEKMNDLADIATAYKR
jgi:hypothetical protein